MTGIPDEAMLRTAAVISCGRCGAKTNMPCADDQMMRASGKFHWLRLADARAVIAAVAPDIRAQEREEWVGRLAAMCDDEWLRKRDRCMDLPGASKRYSRNAAGAWEHAAHEIRQLLNERADYEDVWQDRHRSYLRWMNNGRDNGDDLTAIARAEVTP